MVLVLELVGIGVLGACISVLLCIIAEGTPHEVLKAIGFKENSQKPQINQCTDRQPWENEYVIINEKMAKNSQHPATKEVRANCGKPRMDFQKDPKHKTDNSVQNLYLNDKMTAVKTVDDSTGNQLPKENFQGTTDTTKKLCKYCRTLKIPDRRTYAQENMEIFQIPDKRDNGIKSTLLSTKTYDLSRELYNDEWTKVRAKKRRFVLPRTLIIDSQAKRNVIGDRGNFDDDFFERIICRHCYLEALRIKNNKAEKKSTDL